MSEFSDIVERAMQVKVSYAARDEINEAIEQMYLMKDAMPIPQDAHIVVTRSPDNRNAVKGAARLLSIPEPIINIPYDESLSDLRGIAEKLELMGAALIEASNHYSRRPLHYNANLSSLLYDEAEIVVLSTRDMADATPKGSRERDLAEEIARATPYIFKVRRPGYPVYDDLGLCLHVRTTKMTLAEIEARYPDAARKLRNSAQVGSDANKYSTYRVVWDYWDRDMHYAWVEGMSEPLIEGKHNLPMIPIACRTSEGSDLFDDPADQREQFLLTEYRSGLGARKNMALTALYTKLYSMGFVTPFVWQHADPGSERPALIQDGIFQYIDAGSGTMSILRHEMDPAFQAALEIAERKGQESTIYATALGGSLPAGTAFSTYSLLTQTGRVPLETIRRMTGEALADVLRIAFRWMRHDAGKYKARNYKIGAYAEIDGKDIPETLEINVSLDIALPQDALQQANVVNMLWGKVPAKTLFEKMLKLGQYETLSKQLMDEQAAQAIFQVRLGQMVQQMTAQPPVPQQAPPPTPERPLAPEQMVEPMQGLPPEMALGGGQGPEGNAMMPPGGVM